MKFGFALFLFQAFLALSLAQEGKPVSFRELEDRLEVRIGENLFTEYRFRGEDRFFPVFYPVLAPGQIPMTRSFPFEKNEKDDTDHPHHQSLWFAHSDINGETFWAVREYKGRKPGRTVHQRFRSITPGEQSGSFVAENLYVAADGTTILSDTRTVSIATTDQSRILDIEIEFHASHGPVRFGDEKDAGMAIRVATELQVERRKADLKKYTPGQGVLISSKGIKGKATWGTEARWVRSSGTISNQPVAITILDHPENPRHPTTWHSRTYGLITANIFGKHFFEKTEDRDAGVYEIPEGEKRTFRWRFVFQKGVSDDQFSESQFTDFADRAK